MTAITDAPPPLLAVQYAVEGGNSGVFRVVDGSVPFQIGGSTGPLEAPVGNDRRAHARAIQFKNDLYTINREDVLKFDTSNPTGGWSVVFTISNLNTGIGFGRHTGIHMINWDGTPTMIIGYFNSISQYQFLFSTDGDNWFQTGFSAGTGLPGIGRTIVWQNILVWKTGGDDVTFFDRNQTTIFQRELPNTRNNTAPMADFTVYKNRLFAIADTDNTGGDNFQTAIFEYTGGVWVKLFNLPGTMGTAASGLARSDVLFTDGVDMFCIVQDVNHATVGQVATAVYQITDEPTGGLTPVEITSAVIGSGGTGNDPAFYLGPEGIFSLTDEGQWHVFVDDTDRRSDVTRIFLWFLPDDQIGNKYQLFQWNGPDSELLLKGGGPETTIPAGMALPHTDIGGGERVWTDGEKDVRVTGVVTVPEGEKISFQAFGGFGTDAANVRFYFNKKGQFAETPCTLIGPVAGGSAMLASDSFSDFVDGVDSDDGLTTYTVIWDVLADGVSDVDRINIMPVIEDN